jgi:phosphoglycerate dehydrogenase-like enzyme
MSKTPLTIWYNSRFPEPVLNLLRDGIAPHRLVIASTPKVSNIVGGVADPQLDQADIALGQPDPAQVIASKRLKWVHLDSAGYTRYDREDLRAALRARGAVLSNSSSVYNEPCAQHVLAMMLAFARQLPQSMLNQQTDRAWRYTEFRANSRLMGGEKVLILGFGAIARRLIELLQPFGMDITATRRRPSGDEPVRVVPDDETDAHLADADHVIDILPDNPATVGFMSAARFARMKPTARFYNIGRGTTVNQPALMDALSGGVIAAAYLDVMDPEPLPPDHPLWRTPNCYITPHTGGGHHDEFERHVRHFLANLRRFESGQSLADQLV